MPRVRWWVDAALNGAGAWEQGVRLTPVHPAPPTYRGDELGDARAGEHNAAKEAAGSESVYMDWAWFDSKLTERGRGQALALKPQFAGVPLDVVYVSPLSRAIETALLAIPPGPRFVCDDRIRERNGLHPCDKRRGRTALQSTFPAVDFSCLASEEDAEWTETREPWPELEARAHGFMAYVAMQPERHVGIVTHNDWLQALLLDTGDPAASTPAVAGGEVGAGATATTPTTITHGGSGGDGGDDHDGGGGGAVDGPKRRLLVCDHRLRVQFGNAERLALCLTWDEAGV